MRHRDRVGFAKVACYDGRPKSRVPLCSSCAAIAAIHVGYTSYVVGDFCCDDHAQTRLDHLGRRIERAVPV